MSRHSFDIDQHSSKKKFPTVILWAEVRQCRLSPLATYIFESRYFQFHLSAPIAECGTILFPNVLWGWNIRRRFRPVLNALGDCMERVGSRILAQRRLRSREQSTVPLSGSFLPVWYFDFKTNPGPVIFGCWPFLTHKYDEMAATEEGKEEDHCTWGIIFIPRLFYVLTMKSRQFWAFWDKEVCEI